MLNKLLKHFDLESEVDEDFPENFFPIPNKYVLFQTGSEKPSQIFDHFVEVTNLIGKFLSDNNITMVQVGDATDPIVPNALDLRGKTNARQIGFIVKHSVLCVTSHQFSARLCRVFDKRLILLGSNFPSKYFTSGLRKVTYIEPELKTEKWTYRDEENPKLINSIQPEIIGQAILDNLGINEKLNHKTLFMGDRYGPPIIDFIPDCAFPRELVGQKINIRLDVVNNPQVFSVIDKHCKFNIITKTAINFNFSTENLNSINYICEDSVEVDFVKDCIKKGINLVVISSKDEFLNDIRFDLRQIKEVYKKKLEKPLDKQDFCGSMLKSSRTYIGRGAIYPSLYHYKNDLCKGQTVCSLDKVDLENQDFLEAKDSYFIFKP